MQKALFLYKTPRKEVYELWKSKKGPDTILYGANHLEELGYDVKFFDIAFSKLNPLRWLFYPIHLITSKTTGIGFKIDQAISLLPVINKSDIVVSTIDTAGLPILLFKKVGIIKKPLIYISVDFAYRLENNKNNRLFSWYKNLLKFADVIICYSEGEQSILKKYNKTFVLTPGIDWEFFAKGIELPNKANVDVLAFGRDHDRDYETFVTALSKDINGVIVCSPENLKNIEVPKNIKVFFNIEPKQLRQLINSAKVVVIPIKKVQRASGQLSFLESISSKKPTIVTNVPAIKETYGLNNKIDCLFYEAQVASDLRSKILYLLSEPRIAQRIAKKGQLKAKQYSTAAFAVQLSGVIRKLA